MKKNKIANSCLKICFIFIIILCFGLCSCEGSSEISKENNYSSQGIYQNHFSSAENEYQSKTVYITPTGKRYHLSRTCGGKNSTPASLDDAINVYSLTPCKKCAQ